jgi:hypothetical protein
MKGTFIFQVSVGSIRQHQQHIREGITQLTDDQE